MNSDVVLVTGASGCLGRAVVARAPERWSQRLWTPSHTELDLLQPDTWPVSRLRQVGGVIHLAALVHDRSHADPATIRRANTNATWRLLEHASGRPFVFASSFSVYPSGVAGWLDENSPVGPSNVYGMSKLEAEREVLSVGGVVLRFPICYGPGDRGNVSRLIKTIPRVSPIFPGNPSAERPILGSCNAADALWLAFSRAEGAGRLFLIADAPATSLGTLIQEICRLVGRPVPRVLLPRVCWSAGAGALAVAERLMPSLPLPRSSAVSNLYRSVRVRLDRAGEILGYQASTSLSAGLAAQLAAESGSSE
jgi:nucleoside-diphosphate-sugar epimerase